MLWFKIYWKEFEDAMLINRIPKLFLEKINSTNSRILGFPRHFFNILGGIQAVTWNYHSSSQQRPCRYIIIIYTIQCSSSQQRPCRYIIINKITGAAASTYSFVQADPTGIQVVVADLILAEAAILKKSETKKPQILILAEAAILKKGQTKKPTPSVSPYNDLC